MRRIRRKLVDDRALARRSRTGNMRTEMLVYSWRDLTRRYIAAPPGSPALTPANDWRYRYSTSAEREQKRLYSWRQLND